MPVSLDDQAAWIALIHRSGLGRDSLRRLLAAMGSPQAVLNASPATLSAVLGARAAVDAFVLSAGAEQAGIANTQAWLGAAPGRRILSLADADYPALLLQTADPPLLLFVEGDCSALAAPCLAIVGSRQATPQGRQNARAFARDLAQRGWVIVSGLAAGIDAAAHEGALEAGLEGVAAGPGRTIAVVGNGPDQVYPRSHRALAQRIASHGLIVSEYFPGTPPLAANFPQRNRIIAALSRGTLVVEAAMQSGSLITARLAAEAGREVFAIPGSIHSPQARGCHALIRQGAKLVECAADVLEELGHVIARPAATVADEALLDGPGGPDGLDGPGGPDGSDGSDGDASTSDPVLRALGFDVATLDALMARCGWPAPELSARLLELELLGLVARLPGGLFQRIHSV